MTSPAATSPPATAPAQAPDRPPGRARAELFRALGVLAEPPGPAHARLAGIVGLPPPTGHEWTEAFVVQLVPHAAIYLGPEGMLGGEAGDRVAGFWRALRLPVPADADHVAALLGLYASLLDAERAAPPGPHRTLRGRARAALLHEHLLSWLPPYAQAMVDGGPPAYAAWARLLRASLLAEGAAAGAPERPPLHLRALPPLDGGTGLDELVAGLLAPARSGLILTRAHLAAAARQGGLGLRLGDRRRVLRALLEQDPAAALTVLAGQARTWRNRHLADQPVVGPAAAHWARRAGATAGLLAAAAGRAAGREAADVEAP